MDERGFKVVLRPEWKAKRCKGFDVPDYPLQYVIIHYNTDTRKCTSKEDCCMVIRQIQEVHQKRGLSDLHYNFLIGSDGNVYEGRGWNRLPSKCVRNHDYDDKSYSIAYIGNWSNERLMKTMTDGFLSWLHLGIKKINIAASYKIVEDYEPVPLTSKQTKPRRERIKLTYNVISKDCFQNTTAYDPFIAKQFFPY